MTCIFEWVIQGEELGLQRMSYDSYMNWYATLPDSASLTPDLGEKKVSAGRSSQKLSIPGSGVILRFPPLLTLFFCKSRSIRTIPVNSTISYGLCLNCLPGQSIRVGFALKQIRNCFSISRSTKFSGQERDKSMTFPASIVEMIFSFSSRGVGQCG
jgi:hypothetical protein